MKILIAGSSGMLGTALIPFLEKKGHRVVRLLRHESDKGEPSIVWTSGVPTDPKHFEGFDAAINLAGENIAGRWSAAKKKSILDSRVKTTKHLCDIFAVLKNPPKVFVNASAVGFYGSRGDFSLTESSPQGQGFLAEVCGSWEDAAEPVKAQGIRVICLRIGVVLSPGGGALKQMLKPFKAGLGGVIGSGKQYISWIAIDDVVRIIDYVIANESIQGPVNTAAPNPVTNREFTKTLAGVLKRPAFLSIPAFLVRTLAGEMGEETLLSSTKVQPRKLLDSGYQFEHPSLEEALLHLLALK